jgi:hypothetical protein
MRTILQIKKASRRFKETGKDQIVYQKKGKPAFCDLDLYLTWGLDFPDVTRVCLIHRPAKIDQFQRFRYNPATDRFRKI